MPLTHKTVDIRPDVWRTLRLNAELSHCRLRDYLTFLIMHSRPLSTDQRKTIETIARENQLERIR